MLRNSRTEILVALVLIAPFLAIYLPGVRLSDGADVSHLLHRCAADRRGQVGRRRQLPETPQGPDVPPRGVEHRLLRADDGRPGHGDRHAHRARRFAPEGPLPVGGARAVLPALHPAGLGGLSDLGLDAELPVRRRHARARLAGHCARSGLQVARMVPAGGRPGHHLVDRRILDPAVPGRVCARSRPRSTRPRRSTMRRGGRPSVA